MMSGSLAYTYLIGWPDLDVWYYGSRYSRNCHPSELWRSYFTSSKHVKEFVDCFGDPNVIEIRKTFESKSKARIWEYRVLKRMRVAKRINWLNKHNGDGGFCSFGPRSEETKTKISNVQKIKSKNGEHVSQREEVKRKISESMSGKKNHNYGKRLSDITILKISAKKIGMKYQKHK